MNRLLVNYLARSGEAKASFERFIFLLKIKNVKTRTIYNYVKVLDLFLKWCKAKNKSFKDWSNNLAYEFMICQENPHSRVHYGFALKRFFELLEYPEVEKFIVPYRPKSKLPDILSHEEVLKIAKACDNVRDRALVLVTYESSRRNHEIRGLRIGDVKFDEYGAIATFHSTKSEDATIRLILSASALQSLIEHHKDQDNPEAYVFYARDKQMTETRFRQILHEATRKAGLKRRVYPHLLRHTRIAQLKRELKLSDDDIMNITGHTDRRQLDVYGKITMASTNEKLLEIAGLQKSEEAKKVKGSQAKVCPRCNFVNGPLSEFCGRCSLCLDEKKAVELQRQEKEKVKERDAEVQAMSRQLTELERKIAFFDNPKVIELLQKKLRE